MAGLQRQRTPPKRAKSATGGVILAQADSAPRSGAIAGWRDVAGHDNSLIDRSPTAQKARPKRPAHKQGGSRNRLRRKPGSTTMKFHRVWFAAAVAGLLSLAPSAAGAETIGVFTKSAGNPIARAVRAGADAVAKANGFTVFHYIPTSA